MTVYDDKAILGSGSYGEVWSCERRDDGFKFAKKKLVSSHPEAVRRFQKEVKMLAKLNHPRIVKVIDTHVVDAPYWYIMPVYKMSLRECFPEITGDESRIPFVFGAVLEGMEYAHANNVIHRDLKPENILLNDDSDVSVTDFGLGRALDSFTTRATTTRAGRGTTGYTAPEQWHDFKSADQRSDIFALGRILFELYTNDAPNAVQDFGRVPPAIAYLVERCTKHSRAERFQTVAELRYSFNSIFQAHDESDARGRLEDLQRTLESGGWLESNEINEIGQLILLLHSDAELVFRLCLSLPQHILELVWQTNEHAARTMIKVFAEYSESQRWDFDFTDQIGDACTRVYYAIEERTIRVQVIVALVKVGVWHDRHHVLRLVTRILESIEDPGEALAVVHALEESKSLVTQLKITNTAKMRSKYIRDFFSRVNLGTGR